jgi:hypothetical protein
LLLTFERTQIAEHPEQSLAMIAIGSSLILKLGFTAASARSWHKVIRSFTLYVASLIFFVAFFHHAVRPLRSIAVLLAIALLLRLASSLSWTTHTKPA